MNIYAVVLGNDDTLMIPLVSSLLRAILRNKLRGESIIGDVLVVPTVREEGDTSETKSKRLGTFMSEFLAESNSDIPNSKAFLLSEIRGTNPSLIISTDGIKGDGCYRLFDDHLEALRNLQMAVFDNAMVMIQAIHDDLERLVDISWSRIVEESQEEDESSPDPEYNPILPSGTKETLSPYIDQIDINLAPDFEAFPALMKTALKDLFDNKPADEWNEWLMSCLLTGLQARIPEAATMWEVRKSMSKPSK